MYSAYFMHAPYYINYQFLPIFSIYHTTTTFTGLYRNTVCHIFTLKIMNNTNNDACPECVLLLNSARSKVGEKEKSIARVAAFYCHALVSKALSVPLPCLLRGSYYFSPLIYCQ